MTYAQMGFIGPGDTDQHAKEVWKDHLSIHVCSSIDLQLSQHGVQYLFTVQEDFTETVEEHLQVLGVDLCRAWNTTLQDHQIQHGGNCVERTRVRHRCTSCQLISFKGMILFYFFRLCYFLLRAFLFLLEKPAPPLLLEEFIALVSTTKGLVA